MNSCITVIYNLLVFACTAGFAAYDLRTRRVPDQALLLFCPVALAAPFLNALDPSVPVNTLTAWDRLACAKMALETSPAKAIGDMSLPQFMPVFLPSLLSSLAGTATGFLTLMAAALASRDGTGVGGGDIKLAAALGFAYGPTRIITVLLVASGLAAVSLITGTSQKKGKNMDTLSLPFVPFLAVGSLTATLATVL